MLVYNGWAVDIAVYKNNGKITHVAFLIGSRVILTFNLLDASASKINPFTKGCTMNQAVKLAVSIEPKSFIALLTSKNEAYQAIKHALPKQQESIARVLGVLQVEHLLTVRTEEIDLQTAGDLGMGLLLKSRQ